MSSKTSDRFKVGDTVIILVQEYHVPVGSIGTIIHCHCKGCYGVNVKSELECTPHNGWTFFSNQLGLNTKLARALR